MNIEISTDPSRLDLKLIHDWLTRESYWARGIPFATVERAVWNSLSFGLYADGRQIGFARLITDRATFAYLADVFVLPGFRGQGLSKRLMQTISDHPELQGLRRWMLATADAHGLYAQFGFTALGKPDRIMERLQADIYQAVPPTQ